MPSLNYFRYKIGIQFSNTPLIVEQNNCTTKTLNFSIVYDLYDGPRIPLRNFTIKNWFFAATNIAKNVDKIKRVCSNYEIAFDGKGEFNFGSNSAGNVVILGVYNSSSSHNDNHKNNFVY